MFTKNLSDILWSARTILSSGYGVLFIVGKTAAA